MSQEPATTPAPPQPTAEHQKLMEHCGVWDVESTFFMDPSQPPMEVEGKETIEAFGGFWTVSLFEAEICGAPFQGRATLGYDPSLGKYVSTWIDSMSSALFHFTGEFDAAGEVLEMKGEGFDCMTQRRTTYRTTEAHRGPDERVFEMFMTLPDGDEVKLFTHVYRRAS